MTDKARRKLLGVTITLSHVEDMDQLLTELLQLGAVITVCSSHISCREITKEQAARLEEILRRYDGSSLQITDIYEAEEPSRGISRLRPTDEMIQYMRRHRRQG